MWEQDRMGKETSLGCLWGTGLGWGRGGNWVGREGWGSREVERDGVGYVGRGEQVKVAKERQGGFWLASR